MQPRISALWSRDMLVNISHLSHRIHTVIASASVFANGVDHCLSLAAGMDVEDHREAHFAAWYITDCGRDRLHCVAVRSRFRELTLISNRVIEVP